MYWIFVILFLGPLGALIYILIEVIPDAGLLRTSFKVFPGANGSANWKRWFETIHPREITKSSATSTWMTAGCCQRVLHSIGYRRACRYA